MNRADLRKLATTRLRDADVLFAHKRYAGAYYLAGYAVECALKACIARNTRRGEFPDVKTVQKSYSHDLKQLAGVAGLSKDQENRAKSDANFEANWALVSNWSEATRYALWTRNQARDMLEAVGNQQSGVLPWLMNHW